jgi:hypothetical protein
VLAEPPEALRARVEERIRKDAARDAAVYAEPKAEEEIDVIEQRNEAGLDRATIRAIYLDAFKAEKERRKPGLWDELKPNMGWIVAALAIVAGLLRDSLKELVARAVTAVGGFVYSKCAGWPAFRRWVVKRYRLALRLRHRQLHITFRPNRPLEMRDVYVPLRVLDAPPAAAGSHASTSIDARQALENHPRLLVLGAPGAGKSMLFKHLAFAWGNGELSLAGSPIPVVIELHRLNDPKTDIASEVAAELARSELPRAQGFIAANLDAGGLMLLFDGLDEVGSARRAEVGRMIVDFAHAHERCRVVITCRTAVYRNELEGLALQTLHLAEFSDAQIRRFLRPWGPTMRDGKSVEQLIRVLDDRPVIKSLARNPLLLTIMAYLYSDTEMQLPHSRTEFYEQATDKLLAEWHGSHNVFEARGKRKILAHLARYNQESSARDDQDRRTMPFASVLDEIRRIGPRINVKPDDAPKILAEIVERSGLLLELDAGERYTFAHLTLQEYFAATALVDEGPRLAKLFESDADTWRETISLWCGLPVDSTDLIRRISSREPITAFKCLADAQKVSPELAEEILAVFRKRLGDETSEPDEAAATEMAFAAVAADPGPRGSAAFQFLVETLDSGSSDARRRAAASALSLTNLPAAASALARHEARWARVRLASMGDLAVPALRKLADTGNLRAIDDLCLIGTPDAAGALLAILSMKSGALPVTISAAWALGSMLANAAVEEALHDPERAPKDVWSADADWDWVWKPFAPPTSALHRIVARVAAVIDANAVPGNVANVLDPRVAVPLCVDRLPREKGFTNRGRMLKSVHRMSIEFQSADNEASKQAIAAGDWTRALSLLGRSKPLGDEANDQWALSLPKENADAFVTGLLEAGNASEKFRELVHRMDLRTRVRFMMRLLREPLPTRDDWINVNRRVSYHFDTGWHFRACLLFWTALAALPLQGLATMLGRWSTLAVLQKVVFGGSMIVILLQASCALLLAFSNVREKDGDTWLFALLFGPLAPLLAVLSIPVAVREDDALGFALAPVGVICSAWIVSLGYFGTMRVLSFPGAGVPGAVAFWVAVVAISAALWVLGLRSDRAARNPLHGILDTAVDPAKPQEAVKPAPSAALAPGE